MQQALAMGFGQPFGDLPPKIDRHPERQRTTLEQLGQRRPLDQLHHDPIAVVSLIKVEDLHDGRMAEPRQRRRLEPKSSPPRLVAPGR